MAKKKVNIEIPRSGALDEAPAGDVNISYHGIRIAGLSESTEATLKTGGTVVQHDIEIEYDRPNTDLNYIPLTVNDSSAFGAKTYNYLTSTIAYVDRNGKLMRPLSVNSIEQPTAIIPEYRPNQVNHYRIVIWIGCESDALNVTVNDTTVEYSAQDNAYGYSYETANYPTSGFTLTITDKTT